MVNEAVTDPVRALALSYARADERPALAALLALDAQLAAVMRGTREPLVGQMRLTWWCEALTALDTRPPPAQPVLADLAATVLPRGVRGAELAPLVEGWEALLDREPLTPDRIAEHARGRGAALFALMGRVLGAAGDDPVGVAGGGWALADLAAHLSDGAERAAVCVQAAPLLAAAAASRWSRAGRPLGALAHAARLSLVPVPPGAGVRVGRLLWHRLSGR